MPFTRRSHRLAEAALRRASCLCVAGALFVLGACSAERTVEPAPVRTGPTPDLQSQAFKLTIDVRTGRVDVAPPSTRTSTAGGPSLSLIGSDAISLSLGSCTFSAVPDRSKKRCTFDLGIWNRLAATDLVTPTDFPRPPAGTTGILVFPFTANASPGGEEVVPSPDWDLGPTNFFNDVSCSGSGKTDCFRYEVFPSPLYAGESTPTRQVGFDIPASASSVTVYLVVAADLRDNPVVTTSRGAVQELCGFVSFLVDPPEVLMHYPNDDLLYVEDTRISFCSFPNGLPTGARIRSASLRVFAWGDISPNVLVQRVNWGPVLETTDVLLPTLNSAGSFAIEDAAYAGAYYKWYVARGARAAVQGAVDEQQPYIQFRFMLDPSTSTGYGFFYGAYASPTVRPRLVVQYTMP